jgi:hypothetical protein
MLAAICILVSVVNAEGLFFAKPDLLCVSVPPFQVPLVIFVTRNFTGFGVWK